MGGFIYIAGKLFKSDNLLLFHMRLAWRLGLSRGQIAFFFFFLQSLTIISISSHFVWHPNIELRDGAACTGRAMALFH